MRPIAIYGAGGFGREVAWLAEDCKREVACFLDDRSDGPAELNGIPVMSLEALVARGQEVEVALAVGAPVVREKLARKVEAAGLPFAELIHPRAERSRWIRWGTGAVVCAGNILTVDITIGDHVQINLDCTIGHDVVLGEFATLAPGVHVSGYVTFGRGAYVGTGASIINGTIDRPIHIGDGAVIGAQACVIRDVPAGATVVGVPAKAR